MTDSPLYSLALYLATVFVLIAVLISVYEILQHLRHYNEPHFQLYSCRIILMVPIYSFQSWLSLMFPEYALYFNTLRDLYEAYVLYIFLELLIQYLGGERTIYAYLELQGRMRHPWPLENLKPITLNASFHRRVKQGTLQFVLIKPITALVALVLEPYDLYKEGQFDFSYGYSYCSIINNTSVTVSLYSLALFYMATEDKLQPFQPLYKFLCVKAVIFFSFWQSCLLYVLVQIGMLGDEETGQWVASRTQDFAICLEMLIASLAISAAFSYKEHINPNKNRKAVIQGLRSVISIGDVLKDVNKTMIKKAAFETPMHEIAHISKEWQEEVETEEGYLIENHDSSNHQEHLKLRGFENKLSLEPKPH